MDKKILVFTFLTALMGSTAMAYFISSKAIKTSSHLLSTQENTIKMQRVTNKKMVQQVLDKVASIQQQLDRQQESILAYKKLPGKDSSLQILAKNENMEKLQADINLLKEEFAKLTKKTTAALEMLSLQTNRFLVDSKASNTVEIPPMTEEKRYEMAMKEIQQIESGYETLFSQDESDIRRTRELKDSIETLVDAEKMGKEVQLQSIDCRTKFCKVTLTHLEGSTVDDSGLLSSLGEVETYVTQKKSGVSGQEETIMYISRVGEDLPIIDKVQ